MFLRILVTLLMSIWSSPLFSSNSGWYVSDILKWGTLSSCYICGRYVVISNRRSICVYTSSFLSEMNLYSNLYISVKQNWRFPHYLETKGKAQGLQMVFNQMSLYHMMTPQILPNICYNLQSECNSYFVTKVWSTPYCWGFHTFGIPHIVV